jgi:methyl-accepting chemotaxis protein
LNNGSHTAVSLLHAWASQIAASRAQTRQSMTRLANEFSDAVSGLDALLRSQPNPDSDWQTDVIPDLDLLRQRLDHCLHHLQFQDRIDQVMVHVQDSVSSLADAYSECAHGRASEIDFASILSALVRSYTMTDEIARHEIKPISDSSDELTYF